MNKTLKITLFIILIIVLVICLIVGLFLFKPKLFEGTLQSLVTEQTGLEFLTEDISIQLSPAVITLEGLTVLNPEWDSKKPLLDSKQVNISLDIAEIFKREKPFWNIALSDTDLRFAQNESGDNNWQTTVLKAKPKSEENIDWSSYISFNEISSTDTKLYSIQPSGEELIEISQLLINNKNNEQINLTGSGSYRQQNIEIDGSADIAQLSGTSQKLSFILSADGIGIKTNSEGKVDLENLASSTFTSNIQADSLKQLEILLEDKLPNITPIDISFDLAGSGNNVLNFKAKGKLQNQTINLQGQIEPMDEEFKEFDYTMAGSGLGVNIDSKGSIDTEYILTSNITAQLKADNLDQIEKLFEQELPDLAPLDISLKLSTDKSKQLNFKVEGSAQGQTVDIKGRIDSTTLDSNETPLSIQLVAFGIDATAKGNADLKSFKSADIDITAKADSLAKLENLLSTTLPDAAPLDVSLHLTLDKNLYHVENLDLNAKQNTLKGNVRYEQKANKLNADLMADQLDLTPYLNSEHKVTEAENASDQEQETTASNELDWLQKLNSEIKFTANSLAVNEHRFKEINIDLNTNDGVIQISKLISRYQRLVEGKADSPFTRPISIAGTIKLPSSDSENQLIDMNLTLNDGDMNFAATGALAYQGDSTGTLKIKGKADKFESLSSYLEYDMSPFAPATLDVTADVFKNSIDFKPILLDINGDDLTGQGKVDWSGEKLVIKAILKSKIIDLNNFSPLGQATEEVEPEADDNSKYVFSKEPIDWAWLEMLDLDLNLDLNKFVLNKKTEFKKVDAEVVLKNGKLVVDPFDGNLTEGGIRGSLTIEKQGKGTSIQTKFVGLNITPADLGEKDKGIIDGGNTDIEVNATLAGVSAHELAASLNGELVLEIQNAKMRNDLFERFGSDIFLETLSMINPFVKKDTYTDLDCAAVRFTAKDGELVSKNQIAIETSKMKIVAGGVVNLGTEELEIGFTPIAKKGLGVNVSNLVKFVRLGGSLSNPTPEADPAGILKSGAAIGAAISTGGLSLLVDSLFKRVTNAGTACNHIFEEEAEVPDSLEVREKTSDDEGAN